MLEAPVNSMMNCPTTHCHVPRDFLRFAMLPFTDSHLVQLEDEVQNRARWGLFHPANRCGEELSSYF
jgi:hypothetical protein